MENNQDFDDNTLTLNKIQEGLDSILNKLNNSDNLLNDLENKFLKHEQIGKELQDKLDKVNVEMESKSSMSNDLQIEKEKNEQELNKLKESMVMEADQLKQKTNEESKLLQQKLEEMENEKNILQKSIEEKDKQLQEMEQRIIKLNTVKLNTETNKTKNTEIINKIKEQILKVEERIVNQTARIGEMGKMSISQTQTVQMGAGKKQKPLIQRIKVLNYLNLFPLIDKSTRSKLEKLAVLLYIKPKQYPLKKDLIVAIKLVLHCKAGIIKHTKQLKTVGKNMQMIETVQLKTKNDICKILNKKLSKITMQNIYKTLL
jgi:chromosome segregation ATPase